MVIYSKDWRVNLDSLPRDFGSNQWEGWRAETCQGCLVLRFGCHPQRPSRLMILCADYRASEYHPLGDDKVRKILDSTNGTESDLAQTSRL